MVHTYHYSILKIISQAKVWPRISYSHWCNAGVTLRKLKGSPDIQWRGDPVAVNTSTVFFLIMSTSPDAGADSSGVRQRGEVK